MVIYPGTFDPITNGHLDIIKRARKIFDSLIVAVAHSSEKRPMFDIESRVKMVELSIKNMDGVRVMAFGNLLADFACEQKSCVLIRGLRAVSDFEYELQIGYANASLNKDLETMYLMPSLKNAFISSSVVRNILQHKGRVEHLVPHEILHMLKESDVCSNRGD